MTPGACEPGTIQRQPFFTVASSSAIHTPHSERSRVGMKNSSWCQGWPGLPGPLTNSMDCMHFRSGPTSCLRTPTIAAWASIARISGETAPLLFTALSNQFWTSNLAEPMATLPVTIFKFAMSPYENWQKLAWAGVFLITLGVLLLNILARILFKNKH